MCAKLSEIVQRTRLWSHSHHTHNSAHIKIRDFAQEYRGGCLKDPRQQSTKVRKMKNIDHELSET